MSVSNLALLDALRPPAGFHTSAALGTSYSADLVACMVALTALDGRAQDRIAYGRLPALRALERLRDRVCVAVQQGYVHWNTRSNRPVLALLDLIVRPVQFDGSSHSFHPKVWMVHHRSDAAPFQDRYVLIVGSRNLTQDTSWDIGITLTGTLRPDKGRKTTRLPRLAAFVGHVCGLIDAGALSKKLSGLEHVHWELPEGMESLQFEFHPGQKSRAGGLRRSVLLNLPEGVGALFIAPFLDASTVRQLANRWADGECRLVAGEQDLKRLALTGSGMHLERLGPHAMDITKAGPQAQTSEDQNTTQGDEEEGEARPERLARGLHAKVVAIWTDDHKATILLGSPNLSTRAWTGANCEAFVVCQGNADLATALWQWTDQYARIFVPPEKGEEEDEDAEIQSSLEAARDALAVLSWALDDTDPTNHLLRCSGAQNGIIRQILQPGCPGGDVADAAEASERPPIELRVARFSQSNQAVLWPVEADTVTMPPCRTDQRTTFVVFNLTCNGRTLAWVQSVTLIPVLHLDRDRAMFVRLLGVQGFLDFLRTWIEGAAEDPQDEPLDNDDDDDSQEYWRPGYGGFDLPGTSMPLLIERLLHQLARDDQVLDRLGRVLAEHRDMLERHATTDQERQTLKNLYSTWKAIEAGMRMT